MISPPPSPPPPPPLPLTGVIAVIIVYLVICYLVIDLASQAADSESCKEESFSGLSREELQEVPCFDYNNMGQAWICAICLDRFENEEVCRIFPDCNHVFHARCIDLWLVRRLSCPICRTPFIVRYS